MFLGFKKREKDNYYKKQSKNWDKEPKEILNKFKGDYKDYLKSIWWKKKRKDVLVRDSFKCFICNDVATEVHHKNYSRLGGEKEKDLICLCRNCHELLSFEVKNKRLKLKNAHNELKKLLSRVKRLLW